MEPPTTFRWWSLTATAQAVVLSDVAVVENWSRTCEMLGMFEWTSLRCWVILYRQPNANIIETIDNVKERVAAPGSTPAGRP